MTVQSALAHLNDGASIILTGSTYAAARTKRAFDAMMEMKKIDVAKIEKARRG